MNGDPGPVNDPSQGDSALSPTPYDAMQLAGQPGLPPFPTWPPPSGGAPVVTPEMGPIMSPYPYGGGQTANISTAQPAPLPKATGFPQAMPKGVNGQNQAPPPNWPVWPHARFNTLPDKANPVTSQIQPPPIMGPGTSGGHLLSSQIQRVGPAVKTFPAGSYIDGAGSVVTPGAPVRQIGGLGN